MEKQIRYTEEEKKIFKDMLEELLESGGEFAAWHKANIDWNLPEDNKVQIKLYRIHIGIENGETD